MNCETCKGYNVPPALRGGRCINCLHTENTTLRLLIAHTIMTIASGPQPNPRSYQPVINEDFLNHLKQSVGIITAVNTGTTKQPESEAPGTLPKTE